MWRDWLVVGTTTKMRPWSVGHALSIALTIAGGQEIYIRVPLAEHQFDIRSDDSISDVDLGYWTSRMVITCLECARSFQVRREERRVCPDCLSPFVIARPGVLRPAPLPVASHLSRWVHSRFFSGYLAFPRHTYEVQDDFVISPPPAYLQAVEAVCQEDWGTDAPEFSILDAALCFLIAPEPLRRIVIATAALAGYELRLRGYAQFMLSNRVQRGEG